jgi:hypothetical protein
MALLRRVRFASWTTRSNILFVNFDGTFPTFNAVRLRLAIHWSSSPGSLTGNQRGHSFERERSLLLRASTSEPVSSAAFETIHTEQLHTRSLLRELSDRTRRIEERVRVEKRLVARERGSTNVSAEAQELRRRMGPDWWKSDPTAQRQLHTPAAAVNVDQIAEKVMRQIDHRVSAWRERTGRI